MVAGDHSVEVKSIEQIKKSSASDSCRHTKGKSRYEFELNGSFLELEDSKTGGLYNDSIQQSMNDHLPPPSKFSRDQLFSSAPLKAFQGAVVSLLKPHKIIAASEEFLHTVGLTSDQILGRSIQVLVGPKTDTIELSAAIKNTGHMQVAQINTILYTSSGQELEVTATLLPYVNVLSGSLGGCVLRIDCIRDGEGTFLLEDFGSMASRDVACPPQSAADAAARRRCRRQANAATGLENESEAQGQRARRGARAPCGAFSSPPARVLRR